MGKATAGLEEKIILGFIDRKAGELDGVKIEENIPECNEGITREYVMMKQARATGDEITGMAKFTGIILVDKTPESKPKKPKRGFISTLRKLTKRLTKSQSAHSQDARKETKNPKRGKKDQIAPTSSTC